MAKDYSSIEEFNTALINALKGIVPNIKYSVTPSAIKMMDKVATRIGSTGMDGDGKTFSAYSEKYKRKKEKYGKAPYGTQTYFKNFNFKGAFMRDITVVDIGETESTVTKRIGFVGTTSEGKNRITHQSLYEKHSDDENRSIIKPNEKEEEYLVGLIERALFNYLNKSLG